MSVFLYCGGHHDSDRTAVLMWSPRLKLLYCKYHQFMYTLPNKKISFLQNREGRYNNNHVIVPKQLSCGSCYHSHYITLEMISPRRWLKTFSKKLSDFERCLNLTLFLVNYKRRFCYNRHAQTSSSVVCRHATHRQCLVALTFCLPLKVQTCPLSLNICPLLPSSSKTEIKHCCDTLQCHNMLYKL